MHKDFQKILKKFKKQYGDKKGEELFYAWLNKHDLDDTKPYDPEEQLHEEFNITEAFNWVNEPLLQFYSKDKDATYWKVKALTANVSQNRNDYSDKVQLEKSARTLGWRPLNWNHNHALELPFPESRVDLAEYEDSSVESVIRIPNGLRHPTKHKLVNQMIDDGDVIHVSIEGEPRGRVETAEGNAPTDYNFTALALLEKDVALPGDPLTYLEPLFLRESMGRSLVESLRIGENQIEEEKDLTQKIDDALDEAMSSIINSCGQCMFYKEKLDTVTVQANVIGDAQSDTNVITQEGGIGPGIGVCKVSGQLVKKNDSACTDGRPREQATSLQRKIENTEELVMSAENNDLKQKLVEEQKAKNHEISAHLITKKQLVEATDRNVRLQKELTINTAKSLRIDREYEIMKEDLNRVKDQLTTIEVQLESSEKDTLLHKTENRRLDKQIEVYRKVDAVKEQEILELKTDNNELSVKAANETQLRINAENDKTRIMRENSRALQEISALTRRNADQAEHNNDSAKREISLSNERNKLKERNDKLVGEIRELKRKIEKQPKKYIIRT